MLFPSTRDTTLIILIKNAKPINGHVTNEIIYLRRREMFKRSSNGSIFPKAGRFALFGHLSCSHLSRIKTLIADFGLENSHICTTHYPTTNYPSPLLSIQQLF